MDFPRVLPFQSTYAGSPVVTTQKRLSNTSRFTFYVLGLAIAPGTEVSFRVKWPNGHYLSQSALTPVAPSGPVQGPVGQAGNMLSFPDPIEIPPGGRIAIENSGVAGTLAISFWGFLRVPLSSLPPEAAGNLAARLAGGGAAAAAVGCVIGYPIGDECLIGYPSASVINSDSSLPTLAMSQSLRWQCNRNIMLAEWAEGNQCRSLVPPGQTGQAFTFFSDPVTLTVDGQSTNVPLIVPGLANSDTLIRAFRCLVTWSGCTGTPTIALRFPNGYAMTGGDAMPLTPFQWMPWLPRTPLKAGGRLILDWGNQNGAGSGTITTRLEFDAVKLRGAH